MKLDSGEEFWEDAQVESLEAGEVLMHPKILNPTCSQYLLYKNYHGLQKHELKRYRRVLKNASYNISNNSISYKFGNLRNHIHSGFFFWSIQFQLFCW